MIEENKEIITTLLAEQNKTMEMVLISPTKIKVREGLARYREDVGKIKDLVDSIKRVGQILPIVVNRDYELIDGGRRTAACIMAGKEIKAVFEDTVDPYKMRELELEANLHRKDYSPAEYALAIRDLHELKQIRYGVGGSGGGKVDKTWDITKTAKFIGKSRGTVYNALALADMVDKFPQLKTAKKNSEIKRAVKGIEKLQKTMAGLEKNKQTLATGKNAFKVVLGDAIDHMLSMKDNSVNILMTDPLYGIEADKIIQGQAHNPSSAFSTSGYKIKDDTDNAMLLYEILAKESFRFTTSNAHGWVFVGPEYFWTIRKVFMLVGWRVYIKPFIWIKRVSGQCNVPTAWPSSCYEMLMYIRKDASRLVIEGKPDWFEFPPVLPSDRIHPYQKPVEVLIELLQRVSIPGQLVYDPFAGSGATLEAATKLHLMSIGVDISTEAYACMTERLAKYKESATKEGK
ncbi:MAG: DNA methyltransferase [Candidatus Heimdallarchaeaceae archaeon]